MKRFSSYLDLPAFTQHGFKPIPIPDKIWGYVEDIYYLVKIKGKVKEEQLNADTYSLEPIPYLRNLILEEFKSIHEEWCGEELIPHMMYGVRSYRKGALLPIHRDRVETHHISSIINLEWDKEWDIEIESHNKEIVGIKPNPKEMILYESAKCRHARTSPFEGEFYNNFYLHYTLKNWQYAKQ